MLEILCIKLDKNETKHAVHIKLMTAHSCQEPKCCLVLKIIRRCARVSQRHYIKRLALLS